MTLFLLEIPNAVGLPNGLLFVQNAEEVAAKYGLEPVCAMPPAYELFAMRRIFWQEQGKHYDDMPHGEAREALLFRALEKRHPQRFKPKKES